MKIVYALISFAFSFSVLAELPELQFLHAKKFYKEGDIALVTVVLSAPSINAVSVRVVPQYTWGASELDHTMGDFADIIIAPGQTTGSFSFEILEDGINEIAEPFKLVMTAPQNAKIPIDNEMEVIINDNFEEHLPIAEFFSANSTISEAQTREIKVLLSEPATSIVVIPFEVGGTATHNIDHNLSMTGEVIIYPGMTEASIMVHAYFDGLGETEEYLTIKMLSPVVNAQLGEVSETRIEIYDAMGAHN